MIQVTRRLLSFWGSLGTRYLPFADIATPDLSLSRLLRLSLFQVSCGMALVLLVGTLNRVMIVELDVPASLVGLMLAVPLLAAPFRALIGFRSDTHKCALGWRRVPFIWKGTLLQFGGFAIMPFALLVLAGKGDAAHAPVWIGQFAAAVAFLLTGTGVHFVQTAGLALATDLTPQESHPKVVGLMYVMLLVGMMVSAILFGMALEDFQPGRLVQVIQGAAVITLVLNAIAIWKQETRRRSNEIGEIETDFFAAWKSFQAGEYALRCLVIVGIGTLAFSMADILLEPFGGEVLGLSVSATTKLTALLAGGGLCGFAFASYIMNRGAQPMSVARNGAIIGIPAFLLVIGSASLALPAIFLLGNLLIGFGGALFGHGTLTATMNRAPKQQVGLALGAWGAVQATAAGLGVAVSGVLRDLANAFLPQTNVWFELGNNANGYLLVYVLEIFLLIAVVAIMVPLVRALKKNRESIDNIVRSSGATRSELSVTQGVP